MPTRNRRIEFEQIELFRPLPQRPLWNVLSESVKEDVRKLLIQMLMARAKQRRGEGSAREAGHD